MKRTLAGMAALVLLLAGCGGGAAASPATSSASAADLDACGRLVDQWYDFTTTPAVLTLNGEDLTKTDWDNIYVLGTGLLTGRADDVAGLADARAKADWTEWKNVGDQAILGLSAGDTRAVARKNVAAWSEVARTAVDSCVALGASPPMHSLPTLSSSIPG